MYYLKWALVGPTKAYGAMNNRRPDEGVRSEQEGVQTFLFCSFMRNIYQRTLVHISYGEHTFIRSSLQSTRIASFAISVNVLLGGMTIHTCSTTITAQGSSRYPGTNTVEFVEPQLFPSVH